MLNDDKVSNSHKKYNYIFIIGAEKCGTTALADLLSQHNAICLSYPKEPDFFTNRLYPNGFEWYENVFKDKSCKNRIDASVSYSIGWGDGSKDIARRMYEFSPDAKIIYIMRDPIERTWSSYWHAKRNGKIKPDFDSCVRNNSTSHVKTSMYTDRLEDYLTYFPLDNILLLTQSELKNSVDSVLNKVSEHIGVKNLKKPIIDKKRKVNSSYQFNWFGNLLLKVIPLELVKKMAYFANRNLPPFISKHIKKLMSKPIPDIKPEQAYYLKELYSEEVEKLETKYGINIKTSKWWN